MWLINGELNASISPQDRGLNYGDGVFRTLVTAAGQPVWWEDHYAKLLHDCNGLGLVCPQESLLSTEVQHVAGGANVIVKITITRGVSARGYKPPADVLPTRIISASPLHDYAPAVQGVRVRWCTQRLARQATIGGIKHLNRLENVLARSEWDAAAIAEGLMCDDTGAVISGTMTNLFVMRDGRLHTPDLSLSGIDGVTRGRVLRVARMNHIDLCIGRLETADVLAADEVFLSNSVIGLWRVAQLDNKRWTSNRWTEQFKRWIYETR